MHFRAECPFDLLRGSAEFDLPAAVGMSRYVESMTLEPAHNDADVSGRGAKTFAELLRCEPFMVVRRGRILLFGQETLQIRLLLRAALQRQNGPLHWQIGIDAALIQGPSDPGMCRVR